MAFNPSRVSFTPIATPAAAATVEIRAMRFAARLAAAPIAQEPGQQESGEIHEPVPTHLELAEVERDGV